MSSENGAEESERAKGDNQIAFSLLLHFHLTSVSSRTHLGRWTSLGFQSFQKTGDGALLIHFVVLFSHSVVSNSLQPYGRQHTRLPCPSLSPGVCSIHVHWVSDTILPSRPLPPFSTSQHQGNGEGACITQWSYEPCRARPPKTDGS